MIAARRVSVLWLAWALHALAACDAAVDHPNDAGPDAALGEPAPVPAGPHLHAQYRLDPAHRGLAPAGARLQLPLVPRWRSEALAIGRYTASKSSPAVDEDRLYVGMDDGTLHALALDTGQTRWRFATRRSAHEAASPGPDHHGIHASPAFDAVHVYVADYDGFVYALDREAGALRWERDLGGSIGGSPTLHAGLLYIAVEFPSRDGKLMGLDTRDGAVVFETDWLGEQSHATPTLDVDAGRIYLGDNAGVFHAFDLASAQELFRHATGGPIKSTAALADGLVYVTSWDHALHALDAADGSLRFRHEARAESMSSPAVHASRVFFGSYDRTLYAVDAERGTLGWSFRTEGDVQSSPTVVPDANLVLIGSRDHSVYLLDAGDGTLRQRLTLEADVTSVPVVVDRALYVTDDAGHVYRFDG